jgi:hypothetical protein
MSTTIDIESLNHCLSVLGDGKAYVEWDETEQFILTIPRSMFLWKDQICDLVRVHGLQVGQHINGHGFIRPVEVGWAMDRKLDEWYFELY